MKTPGHRRHARKTTIGVTAFCLCGLAILAALYRVSNVYPFETLLVAGVLALAASGIMLYVGQLFVLGWVVDFLDSLGQPKSKLLTVPLECEQVGEAIVVRLRENIANAAECKAVERQLKRVIEEHFCDFVLDFSAAGRISRHFRGVMIYLLKAARREAESLGKPYYPLGLPPGELFPIFDDNKEAIKEMARHGGHGWVALCGVPVGVRAVPESL